MSVHHANADNLSDLARSFLAMSPTSARELHEHLESVCTRSGIYAWWFVPDALTVPWRDGGADQLQRLYIGIGANLRRRLRTHLHGPTDKSTLRRTLTCLLTQKLNLQPHLVGKSGSLGLIDDSEELLSTWIRLNGQVAWMYTDDAHAVEFDLIKHLSPPLNLDGCASDFRVALLNARARTKALASSRSSPVSGG